MTTTIRTLIAGLTIALIGIAAPATADIPLVTDNGIVAASGNRANGFTLTFAGGETWRTDTFHAELKTCRQTYPKGTSRKKCTAIVRASMRDYVELRRAGAGN